MQRVTMNRSRIWVATTACLLGALLPAVAQQFGGAAGRAGTGAASMQPRQYRSNTMLGDAIIQTDPETRSLVIITDAATHEEMIKIIGTLDRPKPQVLIDVLFLEVTHRKATDIGVEGSYNYVTDGGTGTAGTRFGMSDLLTGGFWGMTGVDNDWNVTLRLLAERGKLEVLSRPSILARNNQEAVIVVGKEIPLITNSRITDLGATINTVQYAEIGIILRVTPFITSEGMVEMIVAPEISTLTDETIPISVDNQGNTVGSPVIAKRSAETVVVTANGQTVVIGGLMETLKTEVKKKVPVLGDIPLLGLAFRRTTRDEQKKELMIFLTPHIVNTPEELGHLSRSRADTLEMGPRAFPKATSGPVLDGIEWKSGAADPYYFE